MNPVQASRDMRVPMNIFRGVNPLNAFLTISFSLVSAFPVRWLNLLGEPEVHQLHPRMAAVVQCLQDIQQNVTAEHFHYGGYVPDSESPYLEIYRVYIDRPAVPGLYGPSETYVKTREKVRKCFAGAHIKGQVDMVFKTKEYQIGENAYDDFSMETTHICGDREDTALRGADNSWVPYWTWCHCCVPDEDAEANFLKYKEISHLPTEEAKALWNEYVAGTPYDF